MVNQRSNLVQQLFLAVLEIPVNARDAWLVGQCGDDTRLLDEVRSLLSHDNRLQDPLENGIEHVMADLRGEIEPDNVEDGEGDETLHHPRSTITTTKFFERLESLGQLSSKEVSQLRDRSDSDDSLWTAEGLANHLVDSTRLTPYQAKQLLKGGETRLRLGNYVILDELGRGGMGQVFLARHTKMRRRVALKILPPESLDSPDMLARFEREVEAAAKLSHPNVIAAHDADEAEGVHFMVMEYVAGRDLGSLVKQEGPLNASEAVGLLVQAARGLAAAHHEGVIHRDVKPSNLIVDESGTVKVVDFGLARLQSSTRDNFTKTRAQLTNTSTLLGTVDFLAPEQARNIKDADSRADIYSLGCTLYYLLTGKSMFPGKSMMAKVTAHQKQSPPSLAEENSEVSAALDEAYQIMVAKEPDARFQSMEEVIEAMLPLTTSGDTFVRSNSATVTRRPRARSSDSVRWRRRNILAGAIAFAAITATIIWLAFRSATEPQADANLSFRRPPDKSSQAARPPDQGSAQRSRTIRVGMEPGMVSSLEDAMAAAEGGDTIEIHTDEPLMVAPGRVVWQKGPLTIRGATGITPIIARKNGSPGALLQFFPPDRHQELRLEGLALANVSDDRPEHHFAIFTNANLTVDHCLLVTYSGGIYCRNAQGIDATISDSYITSYWEEGGSWPTVQLLWGRLKLENNLLAGRVSVALGHKDSVAELISEQNTFVRTTGFGIDGSAKVINRGNLNFGLPRLLGSSIDSVTSFEELKTHLKYFGEQNLFFRTSYRVTWQGDNSGENNARSTDDLTVWQELTGNQELQPMLENPLFVNPKMIDLCHKHLLPPAAFEVASNSPARRQGIGADLSKVPQLPPNLEKVVSNDLLGQFVAEQPTTIRVGPEAGMVSSLEDAVERAESRDVIEIHTNEPLMVEPRAIVWRKGSLTIRAGDGFHPILARKDGVAGKLLEFHPPDPTHVIRLQGLAIINVSKSRPEHHLAISASSQLTIDRCLFVTYSGGIYCSNANHAIEAMSLRKIDPAVLC